MRRKAVRIGPSDQGKQNPGWLFCNRGFFMSRKFVVGRILFFNNADYLMRVACQLARAVHNVGCAFNRCGMPPAFAGVAHGEEQLPSKQYEEVRLL